MNRECEIVQDIMPLYVDDICSAPSREMLEEHIKNCPDCRALLDSMKNNHVEEEIAEEKDEVISKQARFFKRKSFTAGAIIAGIFAVPILICLIVNLASGASMRWFLIVLCSMLLAASLIVVPLMAPKNKFLWMVGASTASLLLLLAATSFLGGEWWFFVAAPAVLFGLSVVLMPAVVNQRAVKERIGNNKGLICMASDTVLFAVMMAAIGFASERAVDFLQDAFVISFPLVSYAWIVFVLLRYPRCSKLTRAGFVILFSGLAWLLTPFVLRLFNINVWLPQIDPFDWTVRGMEGNLFWAAGIQLLIIGLVFVLVGIGRDVRRAKKTGGQI